MSDYTPGLTPGSEDTLQVNFSQDEANYFLHALDFYREPVGQLLSTVPPTELLVVLAYLQSALETQMPEARPAFDEVREFFNQLYPEMLRQHIETHPEDAEPGANFLLIFPKPAPGPAVCPITDEPRIITPGNSWKN